MVIWKLYFFGFAECLIGQKPMHGMQKMTQVAITHAKKWPAANNNNTHAIKWQQCSQSLQECQNKAIVDSRCIWIDSFFCTVAN